MEKVNITIEFCLFELVQVPKFSLNREFWFFGPNLPKMDMSGGKEKKRTSTLVSHIRISLGTKF